MPLKKVIIYIVIQWILHVLFKHVSYTVSFCQLVKHCDYIIESDYSKMLFIENFALRNVYYCIVIIILKHTHTHTFIIFLHKNES